MLPRKYDDPNNPLRLVHVTANHRRFGDRPTEYVTPTPTLLEQMGVNTTMTAEKFIQHMQEEIDAQRKGGAL